jgi:flagellin
MGLRISTNLPSIAAQRALSGTDRALSQSFTQLSSGSRITKAADDAAGLSISEGLKAQTRGFAQASRNAQDGISMVQTAEGGLQEISNIITRVRELGVQASSDTVGDREREFIDKEVQQLKSEAERIAKSTRYGAVQLLDGTGGGFSFQVGVLNNEFNDRISFDSSEQNATMAELGIDDLDFSSKDGARGSLEALDEAHQKVNGFRANLGAIQNRLFSTIDNISVSIENLSAATSRIRDTDVASASAELAKNTIMQTAATSVLSQANQLPNQALRLLS